MSAREYTDMLIEQAEAGLIDWESLATELLLWMSESEVKQFAIDQDYIETE